MVAHTTVGIAVVLSGVTAFLSIKGSRTHRRAGKLFVGLMMLMGIVVVTGAWVEPGTISALGLLFVFFISYLVLTSLNTIRTPESVLSYWDYLAPIAALFVGISGVVLGIVAIKSQSVEVNAPPVGAYFFFAALAFIALLLDINHLRLGGVRGKHRVLRHLWRMNCALFFAISTLFTGPGSVVFPEFARGSVLLTIPQILVILFSLYWAWKIVLSGQGSLRH